MGWKCQTDGCDERAYYGYEYKVTLVCSKCHKLPENLKMVNVKTKRCIKCVKSMEPNYGYEGKEKTHCFKCKEKDMINLKNIKKCVKCKEVLPNFGLKKGKANATHCFSCKTPEMFNVVANMCFCGKHQPSYGLIEEQPTHCKECKTPEMFFALKASKCFCGKAWATFGLEEGKPTHCKECKTPEMKDVKNKKCFCGKAIPNFGVEDKKPTHCFECKTPEMRNVKNKICLTEGCITCAWKPSYKGYCTKCFAYTFPEEKVARNYKVKETAMVEGVMAKYPNLKWVWDKRIEGGSSLRRPDLLLRLGDKNIIAECEESHHRTDEEDDVEERMLDISKDVKYTPTVIIFFNPDSYINEENKKIPSCWSTTRETGVLKISNKKKWEERLDKLYETIDYWMETPIEETIKPVKLFL